MPGSSNHQEVGLSVFVYLRALKDDAWANGYSIAHEYLY